jgi:hypothetical protein
MSTLPNVKNRMKSAEVELLILLSTIKVRFSISVFGHGANSKFKLLIQI